MDTYTKEFTSIHGRKILLLLSEKSQHCVTLQVHNLSYDKECKSKIKSIAVLVFFGALYLSFITRTITIDIVFIVSLVFLIFQTINLVKNESMTLLSEFALQTSTEYFLGFKTRLFLPLNKIYDIVINEVICNLSVKYILIIRTKGLLYKRKEIIPLMADLGPGIDCLDIIYKNLKKRLF